jgi:hypothetical protein
MVKFYPSSSSFAFGSQIITDWSSGCARYQYLEANGHKIPFPPKNTADGATYEAFKEAEYKAAGKPYTLEIPFKAESPEGFTLSGRADAIVDGRLIELKSCNSSSSKTKHLSKGQFTVGNLAQIVTYMISLKHNEATLTYGEIKTDRKTKEVAIGREVSHNVVLTVGGTIVVGDQDTRYTVQSLYNHRRIVWDALQNNILADRPFNLDRFNGPCARCPWNEICTTADTRGLSQSSQLLTLANNLRSQQNDDSTDRCND